MMKKYKLFFPKNDKPLTLSTFIRVSVIYPILGFIFLSIIKGEIYYEGLVISIVLSNFIKYVSMCKIKKVE